MPHKVDDTEVDDPKVNDPKVNEGFAPLVRGAPARVCFALFAIAVASLQQWYKKEGKWCISPEVATIGFGP
jgi:hypothetical protein